jgi:hypothetical protein
VDANWTGHPTWGFSTEKPMGICCPKKNSWMIGFIGFMAKGTFFVGCS